MDVMQITGIASLIKEATERLLLWKALKSSMRAEIQQETLRVITTNDPQQIANRYNELNVLASEVKSKAAYLTSWHDELKWDMETLKVAEKALDREGNGATLAVAERN